MERKGIRPAKSRKTTSHRTAASANWFIWLRLIWKLGDPDEDHPVQVPAFPLADRRAPRLIGGVIAKPCPLNHIHTGKMQTRGKSDKIKGLGGSNPPFSADKEYYKDESYEDRLSIV